MLTFVIEAQTLRRTDTCRVVAGSAEFLTFQASFSQHWQGFQKTFLFKNRTTGECRAVFFAQEGQSYKVPHEVLTGDSQVEVSVFGNAPKSQFATANSVFFTVEPATLHNDFQESVVPTPTLYDVLCQKLTDTLRALPGKNLMLKAQDQALYWKREEDDQWILLMPLEELRGSLWHSGPALPDPADGRNGDLYLHTGQGLVYVKQAGAWTLCFDPAQLLDNARERLEELVAQARDYATQARTQAMHRRIPYWKDLRAVIRSGLHRQRFAPGDQLTCTKGNTTLTWIVVALDKDIPAVSRKKNLYTEPSWQIAPASAGQEVYMDTAAQIQGQPVALSVADKGTRNSVVYRFPVKPGRGYLFDVPSVAGQSSAAVLADQELRVVKLCQDVPCFFVEDERICWAYICSQPVANGVHSFREAENSLTLQLDRACAPLAFDAPEAFIRFEHLRHNAKTVFQFTVPALEGHEAKTFFFTVQVPVEKGYFITLNTPAGAHPWDLTPSNTTYNVHDGAGNILAARQGMGLGALAPLHDLGVADGSGCQEPSNMGSYLNSIDRVLNGSANWQESALRQYLNGQSWQAQGYFDRPGATWEEGGFLQDMDPAFLQALTPTWQLTKYNTLFETQRPGAVYATRDTFFLPSRSQLFAGVGEGPAWDLYQKNSQWGLVNTGADTAKVKTDWAQAPCQWWTRTTHPGYGCYLSVVNTDGSIGPQYAKNPFSLLPCCCLGGVGEEEE